MSPKLDHLAMLVRDLETAIRDSREAGFVVASEGGCADSPTRNALVSSADETCLESISFTGPGDTRGNVWVRRAFSGSGPYPTFGALPRIDAGTFAVEARDGVGVGGPLETAL